jgi:hypothetical protein
VDQQTETYGKRIFRTSSIINMLTKANELRMYSAAAAVVKGGSANGTSPGQRRSVSNFK